MFQRSTRRSGIIEAKARMRAVIRGSQKLKRSPMWNRIRSKATIRILRITSHSINLSRNIRKYLCPISKERVNVSSSLSAPTRVVSSFTRTKSAPSSLVADSRRTASLCTKAASSESHALAATASMITHSRAESQIIRWWTWWRWWWPPTSPTNPRNPSNRNHKESKTDRLICN